MKITIVFNMIGMMFICFLNSAQGETSKHWASQLVKEIDLILDTYGNHTIDQTSSTRLFWSTEKMSEKSSKNNLDDEIFLDRLRQLVKKESQKMGIDPYLVEAVIKAESNYRINAKSQKGAYGLMQLMPATAKELKVNRYDWEENVQGGIRYLAKLLNQFSLKVALAAYNAGPGNVKKYGDKIPPFKETRLYVTRVISYYQTLKKQKIYS